MKIVVEGESSCFTYEELKHDTGSLIAIDDNHLPYINVSDNANSGGYSISDIDFILVPLYEKMYLTSDIVIKRAEYFLNSKILNLDFRPILRVYLTSSRSLKRETFFNDNMNESLKDVILKLPMPRFVWCVDISSFSEFEKGTTSSRLILDATAGTYEDDPWLLVHDREIVKFFDSDTNAVYELKTSIDPYSIYKNNLKEVLAYEGE